jgi:hypothetical protein
MNNVSLCGLLERLTTKKSRGTKKKVRSVEDAQRLLYFVHLIYLPQFFFSKSYGIYTFSDQKAYGS